MSETMPIIINVGKETHLTNAPWIVIIDPAKIKQRLLEHMENYELPSLADMDNEDVISIVMEYVRGPFFSAESARAGMPLVKHRCYMGDAAQLWCVSGWPNPEYEQAYRAAFKEHGVEG